MSTAKNLLLGLCSIVLHGLPVQADQGVPAHLAQDPAGYAAAASCQGCHAEQAKGWKDSDHDWAMREATAANVLGNFNDARFEDAGVKARFFRRGELFFVNTEGADGQPSDFQIRYTFGYKPLQQYLVEFPGGRLQSLTIAWDTRPKAEGGQRWFSLYPGQRFAPDNAMHWTGRYQNWNAMCADCHSSNLLKNYDDKTDSFATTWHEPNVGCQGCHGPAQAHVEWAEEALNPSRSAPQTAQVKSYTSGKELGLRVDFNALGSKGAIEQCAYCHSRRQSLAVGQQPGKPLLDAVLPASLQPALYHADGQIQGEVFVYGSFTQSKMYAAGVTCTDCHDPHSTRLKVEGNGLCQQCHTEVPPPRFPSLQAKNYDSPEHHRHQPGTAGAQCVNCHMPETTYMVIDPRRDHSLRIPRPDLAAKSGSPDACTACHKDKKPAWAAQAIEGWFGTPQRPPHYGETLHTARLGSVDALSQLAALIGDLGKPAVVRATAAEQLVALGKPALTSLTQALKDQSPLVRAYAIAGVAELAPAERVKRLLPLLDDPQRAVRDEVLRALADISLTALPKERRESFTAALNDYELRLRSNADLPGNRLNLAVLLERKGQPLEALEQYRQALKFDPHFVPARVNLVTLANGLQNQDEAERVLREGVALQESPATERGNLAYMLALLLVGRGQAEEGLHWMEQAAVALPANPRIRYNQGLLLLQMQRRDAARVVLEAGLAGAPQDPDLLYALIYLHITAGQREQMLQYIRRLEHAAPNDPRLKQFKR